MKKSRKSKSPACSCGILELPKNVYHCKDCHAGEGSACQLMRKAHPGWKCFPQTARETKEAEENKVANRIAAWILTKRPYYDLHREKFLALEEIAGRIAAGDWRGT